MKQYSDFSRIIHREGYIFVAAFAVVSFLFSSFSASLGWIGFFLTIWCAYFFRNPDRFVPIIPGCVVSPADGCVQSVTEVSYPPELGMGDEKSVRVSIFLSIFNVHVNRIPVTGKIKELHYNPGKFLNASLDKASLYNERQSVLMETEGGIKIAFAQIAGLIARRIVCDLEEGTEVKIGDRFGIIRFGSRVDLYLPLKSAIYVTEGQTVIGGETLICDLKNSKNTERKFEKK